MYQHYTAVGRTTSDLRLTFTASGKPVANFSLAINKPNGKADFIPCVVWEEKAKKLKETLGKGSLVLLEGQIRSHEYEKESGTKENFLQLEVHRYFILDKKDVGEQSTKVKVES